MKIVWFGKLLVFLGIVHYCGGKFRKHDWGEWIFECVNVTDNGEGIRKERRYCKSCSKKETRETGKETRKTK